MAKIVLGAILGSPVGALLTLYFVEPQKARRVEKAKLEEIVHSAYRLIAGLALRIQVCQLFALAQEKDQNYPESLFKRDDLLEADLLTCLPDSLPV